MPLLQNWKKNGAKFRQTRGQTKNGIFTMTRFICPTCQSEGFQAWGNEVENTLQLTLTEIN